MLKSHFYELRRIRRPKLKLFSILFLHKISHLLPSYTWAKLQEEIAMSPTHQLSAHPASSLLKWNFPFHYSNILKHILGKRDA